MYKSNNILKKNTKSDKLIVLDLDETLFHCTLLDFFDTYDYIFVLPDDPKQSFFTRLRPHLSEFLDYIKENFRYGVYTAAGEDYALEHISRLGINPEFLLSYENCTPKTMSHGGWAISDTYYLKRLKKVKKYQTLDKVIAIDDKRESYLENFGNLIQIPPFQGDLNDTYLLKLHKFLEDIKDVEDIRNIEKRGWLNKY